MATYKITYLSGRTEIIDDERSIEDLTSSLCQDGFLVVRVQSFGYSGSPKTMSILERAVATIEPDSSAR